jgi:hypothetical protein
MLALFPRASNRFCSREKGARYVGGDGPHRLRRKSHFNAGKDRDLRKKARTREGRCYPTKSKTAALNHFQKSQETEFTYMTLRKKAVCAALLAVIAIGTAFAQCDDKKGFAKQLCQTHAAQGGAALTNAGDAIIAEFKGAPLSTSLADAIHGETLAASLDPQGFEPLLKLPRNDDGAFILRKGFFEMVVESFSLEPFDPGNGRPSAFFPAPIKGRRAGVISAILKFSELHPDVAQPYVQMLLGYTVLGTDLDKMPAPAQQAAGKLLPKETLLQLKGAAQAKALGDKLLKILGQHAGANSPKALKDVTGGVAKAQQLDKQYGVTTTVQALQGSGGAVSAEPTARGTWVLMPSGFYLRYLPEGYAKTKLQLIVPEAAMEGVDPKKPLTFDPTQYLAVHTGTPAQRLGISLRAVGAQ